MPKKEDPIPVEFDVTTATLEDLGTQRTALVEELKALKPESKTALAAMSDEAREELKAKRDEINGKIEAIGAEVTARAEREAAAEQELAEWDQHIATLEPAEVDTEEEPEDAPAEPEPEAEVVELKKPAEPVKVPLAASVKPAPAKIKPVTASVPVPSPKDVKPPKSAQVIELKPRMAITAAGGLAQYDIGQALTEEQLGEAMLRKLTDVAGSTQAQRSIVASMHASFPPERTLGRDATENDMKLMNVAASCVTMEGLRQSLTAAICAPGTPVYGLSNISTDDRPVFNGLNAFGAEFNRGKIVHQMPMSISDFTPAITSITDLCGTPSPASKNLLTLTCGEDVTVCLEAQALRIRIDNFNQMTYPEKWDEAWLKSRAALARVREGRALQIIDDSANTRTATKLSTQLGAARDLFDAWGVAAAALRNTLRMPRRAPISVIAPEWARDEIISDLMKQTPGDDAFSKGIAYVDEVAARLNLNMIWHLDTPNGAGQVNQLYALQTDGAVLQNWFSDVVSYVFVPGVWNTLSGRTIDLGTDIRDTTTNALNMVEGFIEFFETVFFRGEPGTSLRIHNKVCVSGTTSLGKAFVCPAGS